MILMILLLKKIRRVFSDQVNKIVKKKNEKNEVHTVFGRLKAER